MTTQPVRSLEFLQNTASTARVLNLRATAIAYQHHPEHAERPLFQNASLNKAIILKHRLRANERDDFVEYRSLATKILIPIETNDLRMGARCLFVGQKNFSRLLIETFGIELGDDNRDARTLSVLDETPSLDPFLVRERLKLHGVEAAPCYFAISEADITRMFDFAQGEVQQLVEMSMGDGDVTASHRFQAQATRLARKILTNARDAALEPLRGTMQLTPQQFQEGMFCWKAFLYYKWRLRSMLPGLAPILKQIELAAPRGVMEPEIRTYLASARPAIRQALAGSCRSVNETLAVYDDAYDALTRRGDPMRFRDFLRKAPDLFNELGERLGAIDHIISFWRFRFPDGDRTVITPNELADIFTDFEHSLSLRSPRSTASAA